MERLIFILMLSLELAAKSADGPNAEFDNANRLFETGKFTEAADAYNRVLASGMRSPAVYFNLGNAHFRSGRIGFAIVAYRKAKQLSPRDPDVEANLAFARDQVKGPRWEPSRWDRLMTKLNVNEWTALASSTVWLFFGLLTVQQLKPSWKPALRNWTLFSAFLTIVGLVLLTSAWVSQERRSIAVVICREAGVRQGPLEESQVSFSASDGAELLILDNKDNWLMVGAGKNRIGWLPETAVQIN